MRMTFVTVLLSETLAEEFGIAVVRVGGGWSHPHE